MRAIPGLLLAITLLVAAPAAGAVPQAGKGGRPVECEHGQTSAPFGPEIDQVQGSGTQSPLEGEDVTTCGTVYAVGKDGYWMQDTTPDHNLRTSEGIFVYRGSKPGVSKGEIVVQEGQVNERFGLTELVLTRSAPETEGTGPLPKPKVIDKNRVHDPADLEALEDMRVRVPLATVVAGTNKFGETFAVPADSHYRVSRTDHHAPLFKVGDAFGREFERASTFDHIGDFGGPLSYTYGAYAVLWDEGKGSFQNTGHTDQPLPESRKNELSVAEYNVENYFAPGSEIEPGDPGSRVGEEEFAIKTEKLSKVIHTRLGSPDILGLEEVQNKEALDALAKRIAADGGPSYRGYLIPGHDARGIDNAFLVGPGIRVNGVEQGAADKSSAGTDCEADGDYLFSRPPFLLHFAAPGVPKGVAIVNHFKSKGGDDPEGNNFRRCRVNQAHALAKLVGPQLGSPGRGKGEAIVMGDFNAYRGSKPLRVLQSEAPHQNLVGRIPASRRFSYIYQGRTQFLDHMLVTPSLAERVRQVESAKVDADYPVAFEDEPTTPERASDHDPLRTLFGRGLGHGGHG